MAPYPEVGIALAGRAMRRSRRLANMFVIASHPHLEDRLLLLCGSSRTATGACVPTACTCRCR